MAGLKLKHSSARVLAGHPWVFLGEVQRPPPAETEGEAVELRDSQGRLLGTGLCNPRSQIVWRRFSRKREALDDVLLEKLISAAVARRGTKTLTRLVWSESDFLPGLVVDRYQDALVVQTLTSGMDKRLPSITAILRKLLKPQFIVERNDAPVRQLEGLPERKGLLYGDGTPRIDVTVGKVSYTVDLLSGQKTGLYLDQVDEHLAVARMTEGRRVLDAFCNQGGFALQCAAEGAVQVLGIDLSAEAVESARANATANKLTVEFKQANVFDFFHQKNIGAWDVIILDPPPFARSKAKIEEARRGYKEINLRALQQLGPGGILATYSCSHHISPEIFFETISEAAQDARKDVRVLRYCHQPADHPVLLGMPESEYLKGLVLEVLT